MAASTATGARLSPSVIAFWTRVAQCETGGNWRMRGSTYSGGVGFYNATFASWEHELSLHYRNAADAPRLVQIRVAQFGLTKRHGYWGCLHR